MKLTLAIIISLVFGFALGGFIGCSTRKVSVVADTVYICDTMRLPFASDSILVRTEIKRLPAVIDTVNRVDTVRCVDSVRVLIPITQKIYRDTSYTAWVSGYDARLDSIAIRQREITKTSVIQVKDKRRIFWGFQVGVGTCRHLNLTPYVGIGITYSLWH